MSPKKSENQDVEASLHALFFPICSAALRNWDVNRQCSRPDISAVQKVLAGSIYDFMPAFFFCSLMCEERHYIFLAAWLIDWETWLEIKRSGLECSRDANLLFFILALLSSCELSHGLYALSLTLGECSLSKIRVFQNWLEFLRLAIVVVWEL